MRILPRAQREAMFEIYAFCRAVDDIADDPGPREGRLAALQAWRSDIDALYAGAAPARLTGLEVRVVLVKPHVKPFSILLEAVRYFVKPQLMVTPNI